ncbi:MAG: alpha/beta hydrolase [Lachnospiraceae bacterium]|nr:alpha/beta hydrolase [Lachnospiraceae bacterium]
MKERIEIWKDGEYDYPLAFGFRPNLREYLLDDGEVHPCMIVVPGGGYAVVVPTEGEIVAKAFNELGYNCFVMTYTTNQLMREPLFDRSMKDLARAIRFVRKRAEEYRIDPERLYICGFSAAGHVCASVCNYWEELTDETPDYAGISCRPTGAILSYPVITSGEFAHKDSFKFLLGADIYDREDDEAKALLERYSLEKNVKETNPPCFIWQTVPDDLVPVENSYLYAMALKAKGVRYAQHAFSSGGHGLSVPNEDWANGRFGEPYTMEQTFELVNAIRTNAIDVPPEVRDQMLTPPPAPEPGMWKPQPNNEAVLWPELADRFFKGL